MANVSCLVIHPDGICPGPYGKCTCDKPVQEEESKEKEAWEDEFDEKFEVIGHIMYKAYPKEIKNFIRSLIQQMK